MALAIWSVLHISACADDFAANLSRCVGEKINFQGCASIAANTSCPDPPSPGPMTSPSTIQITNDAGAPLWLFLVHDQPPCSFADAQAGKCLVPENTISWIGLNISYRIRHADGSATRRVFDVPKVALGENETFLLDLPDGNNTINGRRNRGWWWSTEVGGEVLASTFARPASQNDRPVSAGTKMWAVHENVYMYSSQSVTLFEFNIGDTEDANLVWWDISSVDGSNVDSKMWLVDETATETQRECNVDFDNCPFPQTVSGQLVCANPKSYEGELPTTAPSWLRDAYNYSTYTKLISVATALGDVNDTDCACLSTAVKDLSATQSLPGFDKLTPQALMGCAPKSCKSKTACHLWWTSNPIAVYYLEFLQQNHRYTSRFQLPSSGLPIVADDDVTCNSYGWAYDEQRFDRTRQCDYHDDVSICIEDDDKPKCFNKYGNPGENTVIKANVVNNVTDSLGFSLHVSITRIYGPPVHLSRCSDLVGNQTCSEATCGLVKNGGCCYDVEHQVCAATQEGVGNCGENQIWCVNGRRVPE